MKEPLEIQLNLSSIFWDKPPQVNVTINEFSIFSGFIENSKSIKWSGDLEEGYHTLSVELLNKDRFQTVVKDNEIVKDQLLNIDSVLFDDIDINFLKWSLSKYKPDKTFHKDAPDHIDNCVNLGYNGIWRLEFSCPIYIWLLENL